MVLPGQHSFWDVSLTPRPGTISDRSNGLEYWGDGCHPPPVSQGISTVCFLTPTEEPTLADRLTPSYHSPTMDSEFDTLLKHGSVFYFAKP